MAVSVRLSTNVFVRVCRVRVCIHSSSVARSWECCQSSVDQPRTQHAYKCGPPVRLLRRFQFANLDRLVSAASIVLPFVKRGKCPAAHLRSRLKPALQASATAAAFKAPDVCRLQVRLPLQTLRVLREGKPQFWVSRTTSSWPSLQLRDRKATDLLNSDLWGTQEGNFVIARPPTS